MAFLGHHSIGHSPIDVGAAEDGTLEVDAINVSLGSLDLEIYNCTTFLQSRPAPEDIRRILTQFLVRMVTLLWSVTSMHAPEHTCAKLHI